MKNRLVAFIDNQWRYVFCVGHDIHTGIKRLVLTDNAKKAIKKTDGTVEYFVSHFPHIAFR